MPNQQITELGSAGARVRNVLRNRTEPGDGTVWLPAHRWLVVPAGGTSWTTSRVAAGNYTISRTAAGAETHRLVMGLEGMVRRTLARGLKVLGFVVAYQVATVDLTTLTLTAQRTLYVDRTAAAVSSYGGTITYDANHDTPGERIASAGASNPHLLVAEFPSPEYQDSEDSFLSVELEIVMPINCVFTLFGGGLRLAHNYL